MSQRSEFIRYCVPEPRAENLLGSDGSLGGHEMRGGRNTLGRREKRNSRLEEV